MIYRLILLMLILAMAAEARPDEASGIVTHVNAGDEIFVDGIGCVKVADVQVPETLLGAAYAQDFTMQMLLDTQVFLDIDNLIKTNENGCLICVVYTAEGANFNRMLVDSGNAAIKNDTRNEFNPADWWCKAS